MAGDFGDGAELCGEVLVRDREAGKGVLSSFESVLISSLH
jgi:hypothetical protein